VRPESIDTTMRYYVGRDSDALADILYAVVETDTEKADSPESN
jgi:hypothetical protein